MFGFLILRRRDRGWIRNDQKLESSEVSRMSVSEYGLPVSGFNVIMEWFEVSGEVLFGSGVL